jgi:perosamine synthetase
MIPVSEPVIGEEEIAAVVAALRRGEISGTFGQSITQFEQQFAAYVGRRHGVAVTSGTTALHLAVAAGEFENGDEILVSASTNIATALAAIHNNLVPVPVDSEAVTWNLNLDLIEGLITPRTRAIIPVHLYGHPVDMDRLCELAARHNLMVIEDCAESHGATVRDRMTGAFGHMACFSFYANKIITTGEGGMVVTDDDALAERLRLLRNLAFTKPRFWHQVAGHNFRMTGYQAAMGLVQLAKIEQIIADKRRVAQAYNRCLSTIPGLQLPAELDWAKNVYWMYALVVKPEFGLSRDQLGAALAADSIETRTFFCPMNQQPCVRELPSYRDVPCPVADWLWEAGLYLPSTHTLSPADIETVAESVARAYRGGSRP